MNGKPDGAGGAGRESTFRQAARAGLRSRAPFAALWAASVLLPLLVLGLAASWSWYGVESEARARVQRMVDMMHEHVLRSLDTQEAILEAIDYAMGRSGWDSIALCPRGGQARVVITC